jgi:glycosyltransferase involved in cell wall biosynthesis
MSTLVSIIVPTYNRAHEVQRAIDSALAQTYQPCEVIVVDDGSTDETPNLLAQYGVQLKAVRQNNQGRSVARNTGIKTARGEYIVFLDSDDELLPHMVETQLAYLLQQPHTAFVHGQAWMIDMEGRLKEPRILMGAPLDPTQPPFASLVMGQSLLINTALIRRSALDSVGYFEEGLEVSEDWDLWLRLAAKYDVGYTPGAVALCSNDTTGYVERLARYHVQKRTPYIITRAFTYLSPDSSLHSLRSRAIARAQVQWGGCVEFALGNMEQSFEYLHQAQNEYPHLLNDLEVLPRGVSQFATWYVVDGGAFIRSFFAHLPVELGELRTLRSVTLALYYFKQAHLYWHQRRYIKVLKIILTVGLTNPSALRWTIDQAFRRQKV